MRLRAVNLPFLFWVILTIRKARLCTPLCTRGVLKSPAPTDTCGKSAPWEWSWSEWQDLNLRPPRPERGALPDCATLRLEAGLITSAPLNASLRKAMTAQPGTRVLKAARAAIEAAARCLGAGGLVAFPTETVYGLGADAGNGETVARLYAAKGRPFFNPLIAHVAEINAPPRVGV